MLLLPEVHIRLLWEPAVQVVQQEVVQLERAALILYSVLLSQPVVELVELTLAEEQ
jgi:hypothetical protein